jgi:hypothetical protein
MIQELQAEGGVRRGVVWNCIYSVAVSRIRMNSLPSLLPTHRVMPAM